MWRDSWDPDCHAEFKAWIDAEQPVNLRKECVKLLCNFKEGYLRNGPPVDAPKHNATRGNEQSIWIFGYTAANGAICMYVGVCEESCEMRMLVFGPGDKYSSQDLATQRASNWN